MLTAICIESFQLLILASKSSHCIFWISSLLSFSTPRFRRLFSKTGTRHSLNSIEIKLNISTKTSFAIFLFVLYKLQQLGDFWNHKWHYYILLVISCLLCTYKSESIAGGVQLGLTVGLDHVAKEASLEELELEVCIFLCPDFWHDSQCHPPLMVKWCCHYMILMVVADDADCWKSIQKDVQALQDYWNGGHIKYQLQILWIFFLNH